MDTSITTIESFLRVRHIPTCYAPSVKWYMESEELDMFDAWERVREDMDIAADEFCPEPEDFEDYRC